MIGAVIKNMLTRSPHTPVHLLLDESAYFITGAIYLKRPLLGAKEFKEALLECMMRYFHREEWQLCHWVILDTHYHLICQSQRGDALPRIMRNIHSSVAPLIRAKTACIRPVWWNYWDYCPRDAPDLTIRLNYLFNNPVKHGDVTNLQAYAFSSFHKAYAELGREQLVTQFRSYPEYKTLLLHEAHDDDF